MSSDFVEKYISDCIDQGFCSPKEICNRVLVRIDELDEELIRQNNLRKEKGDLQMVLRTFSHESSKKPRKSRSPIINPEVAEVDLEPSYINLLSNICNFIENSKRSVMPREIMDRMLREKQVEHGNVDDKQRCVYMSIKWLLDRGIVNRDDVDRSITPGNNWKERPFNE